MASMIVAPGTTDLSGYSSRRVTIEIEGGRHPEMMRLGVSTITVPYSCFSQAIQSIHRSGGRVMRVTISQPDISKVESRFGSQSATESVVPKIQPQPAKSSNKPPQGFKPKTGYKGKS